MVHEGIKEYDFDPDITEEEAYQMLDLLNSAIDKSRNDENIVSYRGIKELSEIGLEENFSPEDLDDIINSEVVFKTPSSGSLDSNVAFRFTDWKDRVILEVKTDTNGFVGATSA